MGWGNTGKEERSVKTELFELKLKEKQRKKKREE